MTLTHGVSRSDHFLSQVVKPILKKAGLEGFTFHSLRLSHASFLLRNGQSIKAVSKRLGHANASMTRRVYAHVLPSEDGKLPDYAQAMAKGPVSFETRPSWEGPATLGRAMNRFWVRNRISVEL